MIAAINIFIEPIPNKGNPINKNRFLKNLKKCHASEINTKIVVEP